MENSELTKRIVDMDGRCTRMDERLTRIDERLQALAPGQTNHGQEIRRLSDSMIKMESTFSHFMEQTSARFSEMASSVKDTQTGYSSLMIQRGEQEKQEHNARLAHQEQLFEEKCIQQRIQHDAALKVEQARAEAAEKLAEARTFKKRLQDNWYIWATIVLLAGFVEKIIGWLGAAIQNAITKT
ncbi:MAG: hypothetical protein MSG64_06435 [Pyrinomonadaceae bacterium MAG19_C2-C3]|nr:hypothetical protein [Pyrinomonadaceae bacterium MAG19_C2-C3]